MPEEVAEQEELRRQKQLQQQMNFEHKSGSATAQLAEDLLGSEYEPDVAQDSPPFVREGEKIGRNSPCPCGSTKKYKQCHGKLS